MLAKKRSATMCLYNAQRAIGIALVAAACASSDPSETSERYFPLPGDAWERRSPVLLGIDSARLAAAIAYANAHETSMPEDPGLYLRQRFDGQPHQEIVGPTKRRGGVNGIVLRDGYIVAEWGDTRRVDMSFSVTKSYLSTVAGLAHDRGFMASVHDSVVRYVPDSTFATSHNAAITWHHLLTQTSEWEGTLWGKPDVADRRRGVDRMLAAPGTFWEYNDIRVNLLAYALLRVWRRPLPAVLREEIMDPIGATQTWQWHGYETSWTSVDGERVQSVSGGGHWGGGLWASTRDHARFGYLILRKGRWGDRQIISEDWLERATTPVTIQPNYGYMWWLNTDRQQFPSAPASSIFALGAGSTNVIWIDREHDIVTVTRWIDGSEHVDEFIRRVLGSVVARVNDPGAG